jgi:hypothetical protein
MSDLEPPAGVFDIFIRIDKPIYGFADKFHMYRSPFERSLFLDTDTLIVGDIEGIFDCLETHDIAVKPEVCPGWDYSFPGLPTAFPEFTTGVVAFKKTAATECFFLDWEKSYWELRSLGLRFEPDQPSFRLALFRSAARHCSIPPEYHLQADFGAYLYWDVRLIHCHHNQELAAKRVNRFLGARAYHPEIGAIQLGMSGLRSLLREWWYFNRQMIRAISKRMLQIFAEL